ncbi:deoxynucleoside kinase [Pseudoflavonifractor sp. MSJ-30]|uniref:dTMP kinase n=1 Tax=Pseudoflavonifractor sp. MSJ-30 TaxID=2841525 RepID=UPI001C107D7C|nr:deoxynucleoside kinase [Pseudoflavonifractor sp. MSJ-30]MBU5452666.1 deoxynucleoside kinase [Pseudoflavonifractor sp. MSJ-30]
MAAKKLIVIEGLDGSGKATQAKRLTEALVEKGIPVREVSFPDYGSDSSALVRMYLSGQFGTDPQDVNAYAASSFFAVDRFASYKKDWCRDYARGVVIADRYTTSNAVHQCSKLPKEQWEDFLNWLFDFEYNKLGIPAPDRVIYLNVDPAVSQALMTARYSGDENKKDIHERDIAYLRHSREAAAYCAEKLGWETVDCCRDGQMRSIEDIHKDVMKLLENGIA